MRAFPYGSLKRSNKREHETCSAISTPGAIRLACCRQPPAPACEPETRRMCYVRTGLQQLKGAEALYKLLALEEVLRNVGIQQDQVVVLVEIHNFGAGR